MSYEAALQKAWSELESVAGKKVLTLTFLADEYEVDVAARRVLSLACNVPAKDFTAIIILHYLAKKAGGLSALTGEWVSFKELSGIEGYAQAYQKRTLQPVLRKYGTNPQGLLSVCERLSAKKAREGDVSVIIEALEGVPVMVILWKGDEEFGPEANILFDRSISGILCTEDIIVLAGMVAATL